MSIFNNIRSSKKRPEIELLIRIKYGEPILTLEFLRSLPDAVVTEAGRACSHSYPKDRNYVIVWDRNTSFGKKVYIDSWTPDNFRDMLNIMYLQLDNRNTVVRLVEESLYNYHLLAI